MNEIKTTYKTEDGHTKADCPICDGSEHIHQLEDNGMCDTCMVERNKQSFDINERVWFLAYNDGREPVDGKIINKGTLAELERFHITKDDNRIFYEVETINETKNFIFTVTMDRSLYKHNNKPIVNVCK